MLAGDMPSMRTPITSCANDADSVITYAGSSSGIVLGPETHFIRVWLQ